MSESYDLTNPDEASILVSKLRSQNQALPRAHRGAEGAERDTCAECGNGADASMHKSWNFDHAFTPRPDGR